MVTQSLTHDSEVKLIQRQAKLSSVALSEDGKILAVGDNFGKIFVMYNFMDSKSQARLIIQSLAQWHSESVNCLKFVSPTLLLSGGKESVLVQWNLDKQDKTFVSRLGSGEIKNLGISVDGDFYSCIFSDNSLKVCRFDNNKTVVAAKNLSVAQESSIHNFSGTEEIAVSQGSKIMFKNLNDSNPEVKEVLETNPRNFTSTDDLGQGY